MKYVVSRKELNLIKIYSQKKVIATDQDEDSSDFESADYLPYIDQLRT